LSDRDRDALPPAREALVWSLDHLRSGARLVRLLGDFDECDGTELLALVDEQRALGLDLLVLDLTELATFGPGAVRTVVRIAMDLGPVDIGLCLVASDGLVESALDDAGVLSLFELHGSVDEALDVL
jgi:hypothetical protein